MLASELARRLDLSEAMVSRLLSGDRRPSLETVFAVEKALGWSVEDQANELRRETYGQTLKAKMEATDGDTGSEASAMRGVREADFDGDGLSSLEAEPDGGPPGAVGEETESGLASGASRRVE